RWPNALLGVATACYTAFLFGQCEGRDLWQGKALLPHLFVQAAACGAVVLAPLSSTPKTIAMVAIIGLVLHAAFAAWERLGPHHTENARQGAAFMGVVKWLGMPAFLSGLVVGVVGAAALLFTPLAPLAFIPALVGLYAYEWSYVRGGQLPPLS
ncbi:MAG: hypothetical protein KDA28_14780, partial [Phycisphaerales bacterium]|nr:hypothetical protein [Phycisphaerales bacterium]